MRRACAVLADGAAAGFGGRAGAVSAQSAAFRPAVQAGSVLGYKINKAQNKSNCACCLRQAGLRLLSGVYDGYDIPPYEGRGGIFSAKRFVNRAFQTEGEGGVRLPFAAGNAEAKRAVECVHVRRNSRTL